MPSVITFQVSEGGLIFIEAHDCEHVVKKAEPNLRRYITLLSFPFLLNSVNLIYNKALTLKPVISFIGSTHSQGSDLIGGTFNNKALETRSISLTQTQKTIENSKDIEYLVKTIGKMEASMVTKQDLEMMKKDLIIDAKTKASNLKSWVIGAILTSILIPFLMMLIEHQIFPAK